LPFALLASPAVDPLSHAAAANDIALTNTRDDRRVAVIGSLRRTGEMHPVRYQ